MQLQRRNSGNVFKIAALVLLGVVAICAAIFFGLFHIRQVDVVGNEYYSAEEIQNMVMSDSMSENSIYLTWKYGNTDAASLLPFLSDVEVSMINPYHVKITVYEKTIVGYLMFNGSLVYFDRDGMVVEISQEQREGIPPYSGITITEPQVSQQLPVAEESFLNDIITEAQLIYQSGLNPKEVHYDDKQELILYFKDNRVMMGSSAYMEEKLSNLKALFPELEGLSGTLHMENYTSDTRTITFKKGEKGEEELIMNVNGSDGEAGENGDGDTAGEDEHAQDGSDEAGDDAKTGGEGSFSTDTSGNQTYTDPAGNVTNNTEQLYLNEDGSIISDGYGYIDPYTGAYILN
ncbi:MAG: cell division protein FtsQ/DivIB [Eubacteriales bacterium]|nr:cell division protein FtsQ/DivIB [Eubacteriales bacterium]